MTKKGGGGKLERGEEHKNNNQIYNNWAFAE